MKPWLAVPAVLVPAALCGVLVVHLSGSDPRAATPALDPGEEHSPQVAASDARVRALEERVDALSQELAAMSLRVEAAVTPRTVAEPAPVLAAPEEREAAWYLARYVDSFRGGGSGSEYFRLAVEAYVVELVDPVIGLVASRGTTATLRVRLAGILGDPRLLGNAKVARCLLGLLGTGDDEALVSAAVRSLAEVVDAASLPELEARVWRVRFREPQVALVQLVLELAGDRTNASLASLLRTAPHARTEVALVALIRTDDVPGALECFRVVSSRETPTRLAGAQRIHDFRDERIRAFVREWADREPDGDVRRALVGALEKLAEVPSWAPERAVGPANVTNVRNDSVEAWASMAADGGHEWIELDYDPPLRASEVRVHEVLTAGGVAKVVLVDTEGRRFTEWEGQDPLTTPGVFAVPVGPTSYRVRTVRVELDTTRRSGWNEIDAVELVGPDGRGWAKAARASSFYGSGSRQRPTLNVEAFGSSSW